MSEYEELLGLLARNEDCLQRLTERKFYGVTTLSDLPIRKIFQGYKNVFIDKVIRFSVLFAKQIKLIMVIILEEITTTGTG